MAAYQTFETQAIYQAIHDLALWLTPHVGKWPKWIRPTLGHQAMESVLNLFRACVSAYAAPKHQRLQYLNRASAGSEPKELRIPCVRRGFVSRAQGLV